MMEIVLIFATCLFSAFLTGFLGIGGGIIIMPVFLSVLPVFGLKLSIQEIVGISTTCVFINSLTTVFYRRKEEFLSAKIITPLAIAIILGTVSGSYLSSIAPQYLIFIIYIIICSLSIYLIKNEIYFKIENKKYIPFLYLTFILIGAISASIGIAGAILFATALKCFIGKDAKVLLPTITLFALINAGFAFISKFTLGFIVPFIIPVALITSIIGSKIGIIVSKKVSAKIIHNSLVVVLVIGIIKITEELFKTFL